MAKICYSMSGEGRGHAARAAAIVDSCRHRHDFILFASGQAYEFLAPRYADRHSRVRVYPIPGLRLPYHQGRLALLRSIIKGFRFWSKHSDAVDQLCTLLSSQPPDLVISDFEPLLPRAAERLGVPYLSLDHHHFLSTYRLSDLPMGLRLWANLMTLAVMTHYRRQAATVVTSFFQLPQMPHCRNVVSVGPIVRDAIATAEPSEGEFLLSYLRTHTPARVLEELQATPYEIRVYGLGGRASQRNLTFWEFDEAKFTRDLAGCIAVVGAADNQTLGEALFLGKPVLALPERSHFEQRINAFYLERKGWGRSILLSRFRAQDLIHFVDDYADFESLQCVRRDGLRAAMDIVERHLALAGRHSDRVA